MPDEQNLCSHTVSVIDPKINKVVGTIQVGIASVGVAVDPPRDEFIYSTRKLLTVCSAIFKYLLK